MSDPVNQKISQYLDDELHTTEALQLLNTLTQDAQLNATLQRYRLINQAVKVRSVPLACDFSERIKQQVAQEPVYYLPQLKNQSRKKVVLALAASVAVAAIMIPLGQRLSTPNTLQTAAWSQVGAAHYPQTKQPVRVYPVNKRFQDYLQAHNNSLYINDADYLHTRAQLASYSGTIK